MTENNTIQTIFIYISINELYIFPLIFTHVNIYYQTLTVIQAYYCSFLLWHCVDVTMPNPQYNGTIVDVFYSKWSSQSISHQRRVLQN